MRRGRVAIIAVLIVSLVVAGLTRNWAQAVRNAGTNREAGGQSEGTSLANMNSFSLALLLGGLRGPLVMVLWIQSENLKNEKNLEDFDTYVEWIRLLQPEFDTVHIFQVWNKAYNISVQMASWANKYTAILDALEYAHRVLEERPDDLSMIYQIASIYFDKLGTSAEKDYYRRRVREESLPHVSKQKLPRNEPGWRRLDLDPVLDSKGYILPELLAPKNPRPADLPAGSEWYDGSELQYLAQYQPLPYGVSTFGFAYNYHKIAQVIQDVTKQQHANLSQLVVDSRPGLALKGWSEAEWEHGRRKELKAFDLSVQSSERRDLEMPTAKLAVDTPYSEKSVLEEAIFSYNLGARLSRDAIKEYERHLRNFSQNFASYQSHMDSLRAQDPLLQGDRDYLKAMLAGDSKDERAALLKSAAQYYRDSISGNVLVALRYYLPEPLAAQVLPKGITRLDLDKMTYDQRVDAYQKLMAGLPARRSIRHRCGRSIGLHPLDRPRPCPPDAHRAVGKIAAIGLKTPVCCAIWRLSL